MSALSVVVSRDLLCPMTGSEGESEQKNIRRYQSILREYPTGKERYLLHSLHPISNSTSACQIAPRRNGGTRGCLSALFVVKSCTCSGGTGNHREAPSSSTSPYTYITSGGRVYGVSLDEYIHISPGRPSSAMGGTSVDLNSTHPRRTILVSESG